MARLMNVDGRQYRRLEIELALSYSRISQCQKCGHPHLSDFACGHCGDLNPYWTAEREAAWEKQHADKRAKKGKVA